jgi:hypothetical protein
MLTGRRPFRFAASTPIWHRAVFSLIDPLLHALWALRDELSVISNIPPAHDRRAAIEERIVQAKTSFMVVHKMAADEKARRLDGDEPDADWLSALDRTIEDVERVAGRRPIDEATRRELDETAVRSIIVA